MAEAAADAHFKLDEKFFFFQRKYRDSFSATTIRRNV